MSARGLLLGLLVLSLLVVSLAIPTTVFAGDREDEEDKFERFDDDEFRFAPRRFFFREFDEEDDLRFFPRRFIPRRFFFREFEDD